MDTDKKNVKHLFSITLFSNKSMFKKLYTLPCEYWGKNILKGSKQPVPVRYFSQIIVLSRITIIFLDVYQNSKTKWLIKLQHKSRYLIITIFEKISYNDTNSQKKGKQHYHLCPFSNSRNMHMLHWLSSNTIEQHRTIWQLLILCISVLKLIKQCTTISNSTKTYYTVL